ncbi:ProQ/FINO family protein [Variovorax ginsengisoli]|uniref:ProQ/FINO family protein n=1 Tax=Variovorax ginsengisoli TaxID=363844 RepID=A0ABT8S7K0_9BURK|nr:ProQ/FINO family protein [Variovorax ginsengisoli]MDN8614792.1 ProQ/FINO family protein [Variovorax ginsengisoli]MDO1533962.1 ProQ/FINO family protein [Variovorax ginsengisoli]
MTPTTETVSAPEAAEAPAASAAPAAPREGRRGRRKPRPEARPDATPKAGPEAKGGQRAPRKANAVLERLFELYPKMFGARFRPLKLGVYQELLALHPDVFKKEDLKIALGLHARSTRYLDAVAAGEQRHDLNGMPVEPVAPEHVHHAILEVFKRRQARTAEDLRPKLRARLVEAIEASGLSREDYVLAVRTQDEVTNAVLDEAFVEVGARTAKREALLRAFEASGRTVAEFAEMYGMDPAEVGRTLARARPAPGG